MGAKALGLGHGDDGGPQAREAGGGDGLRRHTFHEALHREAAVGPRRAIGG